MKPSSHDFVTVDMRGLKAALVARAQAERVSVSVLVRAAVAKFLEVAHSPSVIREGQAGSAGPVAGTVKLSIRFTRGEAAQLAEGAHAAGLSRGAYLSGLICGVPVLTAGAGRTEHLAALVASSSELSALGGDLRRLTTLLGQGDVEAAKAYRASLESVSGEVRVHLTLAARALADLRPKQHPSASPHKTKP